MSDVLDDPTELAAETADDRLMVTSPPLCKKTMVVVEWKVGRCGGT